MTCFARLPVYQTRAQALTATSKRRRDRIRRICTCTASLSECPSLKSRRQAARHAQKASWRSLALRRVQSTGSSRRITPLLKLPTRAVARTMSVLQRAYLIRPRTGVCSLVGMSRGPCYLWSWLCRPCYHELPLVVQILSFYCSDSMALGHLLLFLNLGFKIYIWLLSVHILVTIRPFRTKTFVVRRVSTHGFSANLETVVHCLRCMC